MPRCSSLMAALATAANLAKTKVLSRAVGTAQDSALRTGPVAYRGTAAAEDVAGALPMPAPSPSAGRATVPVTPTASAYFK
jgi:hypothetical protein